MSPEKVTFKDTPVTTIADGGIPVNSEPKSKILGDLVSSPIAVYTAVGIFTLLAWFAISALTSPWFFPSPVETAKAIISLTTSGELPQAIGISYFRIITGWAIGSVVAIPIAIIAGRVTFVRMLVEPYVNFFRFVPPIAFLGIAILWFGIGEESKIAIIVYTSLFTVFMNTMAGAIGIDETPTRAAYSLGANPWQVLTRIVLPQTVPAILVGVRIGMGFSFMAVIAAELIAADQGIGYLIYSSRLFLQTANAFAGIFALGLMGLIADLCLRLISYRLFSRHALPF